MPTGENTYIVNVIQFQKNYYLNLLSMHLNMPGIYFPKQDYINRYDDIYEFKF